MPTPSCQKKFHEIAPAPTEAKDLAGMRVTPETLLNLQRQAVHPAAHVRHAARNPHRARPPGNAIIRGSNACNRRTNTTGSIVAATGETAAIYQGDFRQLKMGGRRRWGRRLRRTLARKRVRRGDGKRREPRAVFVRHTESAFSVIGVASAP